MRVLSRQVSAMITLKSCQDNNMAEEAQRNWLEIVDRRYVFDRLARQVRDDSLKNSAALYNASVGRSTLFCPLYSQIDVLRSLTLEEFQKWYHSRIPSGGSAKKLSVQVRSFPESIWA